MLLGGALVTSFASAVVASAGPGYLTVPLSVDLPAHQLQLYGIVQELDRPVLGATVAEGLVRFFPDLHSPRLPRRWSLVLEVLDASGEVVDRPPPVIGRGLPPLMIEVPHPGAGRVFRAVLQVELTKESRAGSAPVIIPALRRAPPLVTGSGKLTIDNKTQSFVLDAEGRAAITFDLDIPATVRLELRAPGGAWHQHRFVIDREKVALDRAPPRGSVSFVGGELRAGKARQPLPESRPWITSTWVEAGALVAAITGTEGAESWRLLLRGDGRVLAQSAGRGRIPEKVRLALPAGITGIPSAELLLISQLESGARWYGAPMVLPAYQEARSWALSIPPERGALDQLARVVRSRRGPLGGPPLQAAEQVGLRDTLVELGEHPGPVLLYPLGAE